jgi:hypothetical protein
VWRDKLAKVVFLGTPHHGAPLERGGNWVETLLGVSRYSAPLAHLGKVRSAGITDMRFGNVTDEDWAGRDRFARGGDTRAELKLPARVDCYAIAGTTARGGAKDYFGDGLVPVESALGRHPRAELTLAFPGAHQWIANGVGHLHLLQRPEVYDKIRSWLSSSNQPSP